MLWLQNVISQRITLRWNKLLRIWLSLNLITIHKLKSNVIFTGHSQDIPSFSKHKTQLSSQKELEGSKGCSQHSRTTRDKWTMFKVWTSLSHPFYFIVRKPWLFGSFWAWLKTVDFGIYLPQNFLDFINIVRWLSFYWKNIFLSYIATSYNITFELKCTHRSGFLDFSAV